MKKLLYLVVFMIFSTLMLDAQQSKSYRTSGKSYKTTKQTYSAPKTVARQTSSVYSASKKPATKTKKVPAKATGSKKISSKTSVAVKRDKNGKIARSESATRQFKKQTGFPKGRPGYVIDHIVPLKKGGCDCPANMQWQTVEAAKAKDKWE